MVKTALELAKDTIDVLNEKGWKKGPQTEIDGPLCLGEAIGTASNRQIMSFMTAEESEQQFAEITKLRLTIEAVIWGGNVEPRSDWREIVNWNDAEGRTKQEVMEVLDRSMDVLIPPVS